MLLKQGKTEAEIWEICINKAKNYDTFQELDVLVPDKLENKVARKLLEKYFKDYSIDTVSDKGDLLNLIYLQVINLRIQNQFETIRETTEGKSIPLKALDSLHRNQNEISEMKKKLGIRKDDPTTLSDGFRTLEQLKKKVKAWHKENQGSRTLSCPCCGQMVLLRIRMEAWEAQRHPYFKDKILGNPQLVLLYQSGIITKEDVSKILDCSPEYIEWLVNKWSTQKK